MCILKSLNLLGHFGHLFQKDRDNISDDNKKNLGKYFKEWQTSFTENADVMQNIVDSYNAKATERDKAEALYWVESELGRR